MAEQVQIIGTGTTLEVKSSKMTFESTAAVDGPPDKLQNITHQAAGALAVNPDSGHAVMVNAFANITAINVANQASLKNGQSVMVICIKANATLTLNMTGLTAMSGETLTNRSMQNGDVHLLVLWSDNWSTRRLVMNSLAVID